MSKITEKRQRKDILKTRERERERERREREKIKKNNQKEIEEIATHSYRRRLIDRLILKRRQR